MSYLGLTVSAIEKKRENAKHCITITVFGLFYINRPCNSKYDETEECFLR